MNLKKSWLSLFILISLSRCAQVPIKDIEVCGDAGPLGASCFHTISDEHRDVLKSDWDVERVGYLCMSPNAYTELATALQKLCYKNRRCSYEQKEAIKNFINRVRVFQVNVLATMPDTVPSLD